MGWSNAGWRSDQGGWYKNAVAGGAPFSLTATDNATDASAVSPNNFSGKSFAIGSADSTRIVVVGIGSRDASGISAISGISINGSIPCTKATSIINAGQSAEVWYAAVPSGIACTISVTYSGLYTRSGIQVWSVISSGNAGAPTTTAVGSNTVTDTQSIDTPATVTIPAGGSAVGVAFSQGGGPGTPTGAPSGFNLDLNNNITGTQQVWALHSAAGAVVGAGTTLSTTLVGNSGCALATAVWGP